ncbi:hypothetical protein C5Y96_10830 [Blastopirellula marina]|uniref:Uncharacterized protein n=1 Tax=Blastopirellula marina TaxID=124 RepID=A0A2S8FMA9_9BACT|nr:MULTISPECIES: hypothetical protein [Pirellulaceae]PQO33338.1 hypothetical protein C5Y96_10830 [Blastopirellula marina]RCS52427.1 hypothetical protein DTL36_10840 [Bremerella cremea]
MDSPSRATDAQRWLRFQNVASEVIPPFAVIGSQPGEDDTVDAIHSSSKLDFALRLGRPRAEARHQHDAGLFYVNGSQAISPKSRGRCTQTGMMQALIGYPTDQPPVWGDGLSIDAAPAQTPFYLVPGAGAFKFIDFDGCPQTTFKDAARPGYQFRVGWIVPASPSGVLDGAIIKDSQTLATLSPGAMLSLRGRDNPELVPFGLSESLPYSSETQSLLTRGFHRIHTTGHYLLCFTARIRATEADANVNIPSNLTLTCRTNRINNTDAFYTVDQVEALAATDDLSEVGSDYNFHALDVGAEDQPADTQLVEGETVEVHRHWQTVSGSTVLRMTEGELFFMYNSTLHEIEVSGVSGTLVLLSGASSGGGGVSHASSSASSTDSGFDAAVTTALDNRVTTVAANVDTLQATVTTHGTTISSHTAALSSLATSIAANASAISGNADDIGNHSAAIVSHETRIGGLEAFETSATAAISANTSAISGNSDDIASSAAAIAVNSAEIGDLQTFQTTTQAAFAEAIADGTITTATGDQVAIAGGIVTDFTPGPVTLPGTAGTNTYFLQTNGNGTTAWAKAVSGSWLVNGSGHLVPETNNVRDIGTTSIKPRHLYLAGNATIDGTMTVSGVNVIGYMNSVGLVTANNTSDIDDLQTLFAAGVHGNFIDGLLIHSDTDTAHDLQIGAGSCASSDGAAIITNGSTTVIAIDDSGDRVDSSSLDASTDYYVLAGMDGGSFVAGFSKVNSLPTGWDCFRAIGLYRTNSSSQLRETSMRSHDRFVTYQTAITAASYLASNTPTSGTLVDTQSPRLADLAVDCQSIVGNATNGCIINMANGNYGSATANNGPRKHYHPVLGSFSYTNLPVTLLTNASGQVYHWCYNTGSGTLTRIPTESLLTIFGYYWSPS